MGQEFKNSVTKFIENDNSLFASNFLNPIDKEKMDSIKILKQIDRNQYFHSAVEK